MKHKNCYNNINQKHYFALTIKVKSFDTPKKYLIIQIIFFFKKYYFF
jgi:hypothetical protein